MIHVKIRNFQSIESLDLEISGFTVFTGRSNIGKSAVIRAVSCALSNTSGTWFVRHIPACPRKSGRKTCKCFSSVELTVAGHTVLWEKGEGTNRYTVDGVLYDKSERGFPPFLEPLGLSPIPVGDSKELVQFSSQWKPLFLFGRPPSEVASVVGDVGDLPKIHSAVKASEKDRKEAASLLKVRDSDLSSVREEVKAYEDLAADGVVLDSLRILSSACKEAAARLGVLRKLRERYSLVQGGVDRIQQSLDSSVLSDPAVVTSLASRVALFHSYRQRLSSLTQGITSLESLQPAVPEVFTDISRYKTLLSFSRRISALGPIEEPPEPPVFPEFKKWATLRKFANRLQPLSAECSDLERRLTSLEEEGAALGRELSTFPSVCQSCGQEICTE